VLVVVTRLVTSRTTPAIRLVSLTAACVVAWIPPIRFLMSRWAPEVRCARAFYAGKLRNPPAI